MQTCLSKHLHTWLLQQSGASSEDNSCSWSEIIVMLSHKEVIESFQWGLREDLETNWWGKILIHSSQYCLCPILLKCCSKYKSCKYCRWDVYFPQWLRTADTWVSFLWVLRFPPVSKCAHMWGSKNTPARASKLELVSGSRCMFCLSLFHYWDTLSCSDTRLLVML